MQFLGGRHGYTPASDTAQANCLQLALNAADIWEESYSARRGEDQGAEFSSNRLQAWFSTLLGFKAATGSDGPYFFGAEPTYADFQLLNVLRILQFMFEVEQVDLPPALAEWQAAMEARPGVARYLEGAEPVLYDQVKAGAVLPTAEEIAAWRAANEGGGDGSSQKPRL